MVLRVGCIVDDKIIFTGCGLCQFLKIFSFVHVAVDVLKLRVIDPREVRDIHTRHMDVVKIFQPHRHGRDLVCLAACVESVFRSANLKPHFHQSNRTVFVGAKQQLIGKRIHVGLFDISLIRAVFCGQLGQVHVRLPICHRSSRIRASRVRHLQNLFDQYMV